MTDNSALTVFKLRPRHGQAIKPNELIQISGHANLSLSARRAITVLWHNAHQQGIEEGRDYVIDLAELRTDGNRALAPIEDAIVTLMQTVLTIHMPGGGIRRVQFLGGNDMGSPDRLAGSLTYSFDKRLVEILSDSRIWAKIAIPVLMAFSSKYTVSLYEHACQWTSLQHKLIQHFSLAELRELLGVEERKYKAFGDLNINVIKPAVAEINALAPFNITVTPVKTGRAVSGVEIMWWRKSRDELQEAFLESQRPKVGRKARLVDKGAKDTETAPGAAIRGPRAGKGGAGGASSEPVILDAR